MNIEKRNIPFEDDSLPITILQNGIIELFNELDILGMYAYVRMMIEHKTRTLPEIIDKLIEKFQVDHDFVLFVFKKFQDAGVFMIAKQED